MEWAATAVSVVLLFFYVWYGNGNYMSMDYTKMRDFAYLETMVTQIKSLDGYSDELPLAFIGNDIVDETEQTSVGIVDDQHQRNPASASDHRLSELHAGHLRLRGGVQADAAAGGQGHALLSRSGFHSDR